MKYTLRNHLLSIGVLLATLAVDATPQEAVAAATADTVKVGIFINSLYDLNLQDQSYQTVFWMWFLYDSPTYDPLRTEIVNAKSDDILQSYTDSSGKGPSKYYTAVKYRAVMIQDWDIADYPFDQQQLELKIEDSELNSKKLVYKVDAATSRIDSTVALTDWHILGGSKISALARDKVYATNWSDPNLQNKATSTYTQAVFSLTIERKSGRIFFNTFIGYYVAFLMVLLSYAVQRDDLSSRFGLSTGAIFAAIGNKYAIDSSLPPGTSFLLNDALQFSSFFSILVTLGISILTVKLLEKDRPKFSRRLNLYAPLALLGAFVLVNLYFILKTAALS